VVLRLKGSIVIAGLSFALLLLPAALVFSPRFDGVVVVGLWLSEMILGRSGADGFWLGLGLFLDVVLWGTLACVILSVPEVVKRIRVH
jgi:hypothetical protein